MGGGALSARPLTFFLFIVFCLKDDSAILKVCAGRCGGAGAGEGVQRLQGEDYVVRGKEPRCRKGCMLALVSSLPPDAVSTMVRQSQK